MASVLSAPHFHNEEAAFEYVEAHLWPKGPVCPHCGASGGHIGRLVGKTTRAGLRKCYGCRKPFTVRMGSIFEDSHLPLRLWLQAVHLICSSKKGISTRQLQRTLGVGMKTAWFLGHRIREAMTRNGNTQAPPSALMGGSGKTLEADLTYVGRKPGTKVKGGTGHVNPVLALVERGGEARSFHVPDVTGATLHGALARNAAKESHFRTDEAHVFRGIGWNFASHETVRHTANEYVRGDAHTNTVEGFFSILKRGVYGVYQHVSEAHLHRYLAEFDFRYSNREKVGIDDTARASLALKGAKGKRLTYETTGGAK
jgi:transposase-like protein